jgi:alginate biosynthesis protein AlgX
MTRLSLIKPSATLAVLGLAISLQNSVLAAEPPTYSIEPCCNICPQALEDATYDGDMNEFNKLVQGQDDWLFRTRTDLMTQMGTSADGYKHLQRLRDGLAKRGVELMVVYIPTRGMINADMLSPQTRQGFDLQLAKNNYLQVVERMRSIGIKVPDLTPLLEQHGDTKQPFFFKRDHHWTPHGAAFTAELVAAELRKSSLFKTIPRKEFVSRSEGQNNKIGSLNQAFGKICGYNYANQFVTRFVTEPKEESSDLFGDADVADVILAGTSFSAPQYNFGGFLKEKAGVDVDNRSISGGGFHSAMLQYLGSQDFQDNPPKILIWEITSYYDISMPLFYRQIMPMLADGCRATPAALSNKVALHPGRNEVLINSQDLPLRSKDYLVDVQFSQANVMELRSSLWYMSGSRENLLISRNQQVEPDGRFVFGLRDDPEWAGQTLLSMEIEVPADMPAGLKVEATLCSRHPANQTAQAD